MFSRPRLLCLILFFCAGNAYSGSWSSWSIWDGARASLTVSGFGSTAIIDYQGSDSIRAANIESMLNEISCSEIDYDHGVYPTPAVTNYDFGDGGSPEWFVGLGFSIEYTFDETDCDHIVDNGVYPAPENAWVNGHVLFKIYIYDDVGAADGAYIDYVQIGSGSDFPNSTPLWIFWDMENTTESDGMGGRNLKDPLPGDAGVSDMVFLFGMCSTVSGGSTDWADMETALATDYSTLYEYVNSDSQVYYFSIQAFIYFLDELPSTYSLLPDGISPISCRVGVTDELDPTQTPTPIPTDTPIPTNTPVPTPTHSPTENPLPTNTHTPTPSPTPTQTPTPTHTPTATNTPVNTSTHTPTPTPYLPAATVSIIDTEVSLTPVPGMDDDGVFGVAVTAAGYGVYPVTGDFNDFYVDFKPLGSSTWTYIDSGIPVANFTLDISGYGGGVYYIRVKPRATNYGDGVPGVNGVVIVSLPTATRTPTPTPTDTHTPTRTPTPTNTVPTSTPTDTHTPNPVATDTPTPSNTPTATDTPTNTATSTHTPTHTYTPTHTPTPTNTVPTSTPTQTNTPDPVATNTFTPTPTPTINTPPTPYIQAQDVSGYRNLTEGGTTTLNMAYGWSGTTIPFRCDYPPVVNVGTNNRALRWEANDSGSYTLISVDANDPKYFNMTLPISQVDFEFREQMAWGGVSSWVTAGKYTLAVQTYTPTPTQTNTFTPTNTPTITPTPTNTEIPGIPTDTPTVTQTPTPTPTGYTLSPPLLVNGTGIRPATDDAIVLTYWAWPSSYNTLPGTFEIRVYATDEITFPSPNPADFVDWTTVGAFIKDTTNTAVFDTSLVTGTITVSGYIYEQGTGQFSDSTGAFVPLPEDTPTPSGPTATPTITPTPIPNTFLYIKDATGNVFRIRGVPR